MMYLETAIAMYQNQNMNVELNWPDGVIITLENGGVQEVNLELFYKVNEVIEKFQIYANSIQEKRIEAAKQKVIDVLGEDFLVLFKIIEIPKPKFITYELNDTWINGSITNEILKTQVDAVLAG